jgi:hypothetical protein
VETLNHAEESEFALLHPGEYILVACECSGSIRDALRARGYKAISCDLQPTEVPGPHLQQDVLLLMDKPWRGVIAHPTCTFLANSGVRWLWRKTAEGMLIPNEERWVQLKEGAAFFPAFDRAEHIERRATENPIMHKYAAELVGRRQTQVVQPWWFGDRAFKATGWWLNELPPLQPTNRLTPPKPGTPEYKEWSAVWLCPPGPERAIIRSRFQPGHAAAVASRWGPLFGVPL